MSPDFEAATQSTVRVDAIESAATRIPVETLSPPREPVETHESATADKADGEAFPVTSFL